MKEQLGWRAIVRSVKENAPYWAEKLPEMPMMLYENLRQQHNIDERERELRKQQLLTQRQASTSLFWTVLTGSGLICTTLLWNQTELSEVTIGAGIVTVLLGLMAWRTRPKTKNSEFV